MSLLASTLLPLVAEKIIDAVSTESSPAPAQNSTSSPLPSAISQPSNLPSASHNMDVHNVLSNSALPIRPTFYDTPQQLGPSLILPFQFKLHDWTGEVKLISTDLAASPNLKKIIEHYRFAELTSLEVVVCPRRLNATYPGTIEIRFTASDITVSQDTMCENPGAVSISCGGPIGFISNSAISCPLDRFSPVVKSPFLPTDRIKVSVNHWLNPDATKVANANPIITTLLRGNVRVAYPAYG